MAAILERIWYCIRPVAERVAVKVFARSPRMRTGLSLISQGIDTILAPRWSRRDESFLAASRDDIPEFESDSIQDCLSLSYDPAAVIGDTTIVWIGRFIHKGGYGVATRGTYRALKESGLNVIGIDHQTGRPVDDAGNAQFTTQIGRDGTLILGARDRHRKVVCIFQETPPQWSRLSVRGNVHLVGYTLTETEQIPFDWAGEMTAVDRLFVPTEWNKDVLARAGLPASMIEVVPLVADARLFAPRDSLLPFRAANGFRFLHVASNLNRKDFGTLIRAYCDAFSPDEDVSLIIKLPGDADEDDMKRFISDAVFPWIDFGKTRTPHILLMPVQLSDEKLIELYASCHAYVSVERGKGWDLPAMEAMLMGLPTLNISWSANTTFQNADNSVAIPPLERTVFTSEETVQNVDFYAGHTWAACDVHAVAEGLRRLRADYDSLRELALRARPVIADGFSPSKVCDRIKDYVLALPQYEFHSKKPAEIRLAPRGIDRARDKDVRKLLYEQLPSTTRRRLAERFEAGQNVQQWIDKRRDIYKECGGPVLPPPAERRRLERLRNRYYGQSIFIIGNGPSLREIDFDVLRDYHCFAANKIYLMFDRTDWRPDFYTSLDWRVTPDCHEEINRLSGMTLFFAYRFHGMLREGEDVFWYESFSPGRLLSEKFEPDAPKGLLGGGGTLSAALQLAFFMGFRRLFLIGVDSHFVIPQSVVQSGGDHFGTGVQINLESTEDDPNHFDPRYFGRGAKWHDPNLDEQRRGFRAAHRAIHMLGGELYNSTIGGKLESVPRMPFDEALEYADKKSSKGA